MKIIYKPDATVGQIVTDLEQIVAKKPAVLIDYINVIGNIIYVEGIKLRKDIAILETTGKRKRAATAEDLLAMFRLLDASLGVVIADDWELMNLMPNEDGSIIQYIDEEDFCVFTMDRNVQLITTQQIETELKKIDKEGFLDYKVVPVFWHNNTPTVYRVNSLRMNYFKQCLCYDKDTESDSITVGELLEEFPYCSEFGVMIEGNLYTLDVNEDGCFYSFPKLGDEKVFAIHLCDMYDPYET